MLSANSLSLPVVRRPLDYVARLFGRIFCGARRLRADIPDGLQGDVGLREPRERREAFWRERRAGYMRDLPF